MRTIAKNSELYFNTRLNRHQFFSTQLTMKRMATFHSNIFPREWPRPSVRNLLILVAAIGVCLGGIVEIRARRARFTQLASDHEWQSGQFTFAIAGESPVTRLS